ncbi:MAG: hypothetical protein GY759_13525 [Chloroflexi bacterium]|nr:hypothetical protein [Chloroflexota bacterium]
MRLASHQALITAGMAWPDRRAWLWESGAYEWQGYRLRLPLVAVSIRDDTVRPVHAKIPASDYALLYPGHTNLSRSLNVQIVTCDKYYDDRTMLSIPTCLTG